VSEEVAGLHLVLGDEELLVERAVAAVLRQARKRAGTDDVPVDRLRAGEVSTSELAELLSPSLFADERVVVLEAAAEAGKDAVSLIAVAAADLPPGTMLIVVHSGGGRAKALADQLKNLGAQVHPCARITRASERADFVRHEFRALKVKVSDDTVTAVLDAVGSDIRELAAVCSQLVADTDGTVDAAAVRRYHSGKAEVKGFDIADKAVVGDVAGAAEALRWAMMRGEPQVVLADALAEAVHTIARVAPMSGDPYRLAAELGMPPWRVQKAQKQARRWSRASVAEAMRLVATLKTVAPQVTEDHIKVHRPWGSYQSVDNGDRHQVKRIIVKPGGRLSLQKHHHRSEHWIVVRGAARVTVNELVKTVHENESIYIPIGAVHRLENPGKIQLELIEVQTGSYFGEDDIIRIEDDYQRT